DHEYLRRSMGAVVLFNVLTQEESEFLSKDAFVSPNYDFILSADRKFAALRSNYTKLWRHSFMALYSIYDIENNVYCDFKCVYLHLQAYVWGNNVYVKTSPTAKSEQVTFDGKENLIFNGHPDWVYEEEMFSSNQGLWWSPGGKYVAYIQSNDTLVHTIEYSWYGDEQYPSTVSLPYPKPGTPNPVVKLFVVDSDNTTQISEVLVPTQFRSEDHYLASVTWATDSRLAVQWLKRLQNHLILQIYNLTESDWQKEEHSSSGWIGRFSPPEPVFAADKNSYYLLKSDGNGYKHIHHRDNSGETAITTGTWEVVSILKVTEDSVYYSSNEKDERPGGRNVYRWTNGQTQCLTCGFDDDCQSNSAYFSHGASFYLLSCRGQSHFAFFFPLHSSRAVHTVLEDNKAYMDLIADIAMPTTTRGTIKVAGFDFWYLMVLPPGFDESKKYPLLIDVYGGPCSQEVDYVYRTGWATYLASTEKVIVASFDGRGSGYRGDEIMHQIYKRLGTYEVEDQITAAREFIKMGFVDKDNIAIWGWSYGGYVTSMVLGSGSGVFKCGMAVAPVSKWTYYDSIYTERYMQQPSENQEYYDNSTVTGRAKNFHAVKYLLIHGTADDNVHFQQAAEISEALVEEQVDFEAMWYTDRDHGIGGSARLHVYTHMSHFLQRCFA
uniref:Dipeptidyl peptidase 4-like n=1 Tax=Salarias fasciatus TaxID=181472 RepID=A0A672I4L9_SALFA